jgi:hypothetical protein
MDKLALDAPGLSGWHHAHGVDPIENRELARRSKLL